MLKKILKKIYISKPISFLANVFGPLCKGKGAILMYHRILPEKFIKQDMKIGLAVSCENFEKHLITLKSKYKFVSMDMFLENLENKKDEFTIVLTFDDGYKDNFIHALPILKKHKIPALIYVTTNFLEKKVSMWWYELKEKILNSSKLNFEYRQKKYVFNLESDEDKLSAFNKIRNLFLKVNLTEQNQLLKIITGNEEKKNYANLCLNLEEIRSLDQDPLITIGSHTHTHPNLKNLSSNEVELEIKKSLSILENLLQHKIKHFSYPYGDKNAVSSREIEIVKKLSFNSAVTTQIYPVSSKNIFSLPRIFVGNDTCDRTLINHLTGFYNLFKFFVK